MFLYAEFLRSVVLQFFKFITKKYILVLFIHESNLKLTTIVLPKMLNCPESEITLSTISTFTIPLASAVTFPRSPTWRSASVGPA